MVGLSVSLSVCLLVTFVSPAKMAEPIEMPFGELTRVGQRNHVVDGVQVSPWKGQFWGFVWPIVKHGNHHSGVSRSKTNQ